MKRFIRAAAAVLLLISLLAVPALAFTPYTAYSYDIYGHSTPSANGYEVTAAYAVREFGLTGTPRDLHHADGRLYILADDGVAVLDEQLRPVSVLRTLTYGDEVLTLDRPRGIFAADDEHILIADTEAHRVLECTSDGRVTRILQKPTRAGQEEGGYLDKLDFRPIKVLYGADGDVFVLVENCYLGILRYDAAGTFRGFFAAQKVTASLSQMIDKLWKRLLTKKQRSYIANYVPVDLTSFDIDAEGFIYTTTSRSNSTVDEIQRLNAVGKNILRADVQYDTLGRGDYGDREKLVYRQRSVDSKLIDVTAAENGVFAALDLQRSRVFVYDGDSELLFIFGGSGEQRGLFRHVAAIESIGDRLIVLDDEKGTVTAFSPTPFGRLVLTAAEANARGRYEEALAPWQEVLRLDAGSALACRGIGKAYVSLERYAEAMPYLRRGGDRENYSKALRVVRSDRLQAAFYPLLGAVAVLAVLIVCRRRLPLRRAAGRWLAAHVPPEERPTYPMRHLIVGFDGLRRSRSRVSLITAAGLVVLLFFSSLLMQRCTGFIFRLDDPRKFNVLFIAARSLGLFLLWCLSSAGVSSMLEGEGSARRIFVVSAYALLPMILARLLYVLLSNAAIYDEGALLQAMLYAGYLWTAWLLFYAIKEVHQFTVSRTLLAVVMTVAGMLMCGLILVLVYGLMQQLITFVMTVVNELLLRTV